MRQVNQQDISRAPSIDTAPSAGRDSFARPPSMQFQPSMSRNLQQDDSAQVTLLTMLLPLLVDCFHPAS